MITKQYKRYLDVPKKYRWDLESLLENKSAKETMQILFEELKKEITIKDSKYNSSKEYLQALKTFEKIEIIINKFSNYLTNSLSQDIVDSQMSALSKEFEFKMYEYNQMLGSEDVRFFKNASKLSKWAKLPEFKNYKKMIEDKLEEKKHQLPSTIEKFIIAESRANISAYEPFQILTNVETKYGFVTTKAGKKIQVTNANKTSLAKHSEHNVRKAAAIAFRQGTLDHKETLSNLLYQHFKRIATQSKLRKFPTTIDFLLFDDRVDSKLLDILYSSVKSNINIFKKQRSWHKKFYKAKFNKPLTKYDLSVDLVKTKSKYTPEEAKAITLKAFVPFGEEYISVVKRAYKENWIDFMPVKNKWTGAYSIGSTYGIDKKFLLMNFDGKLASLWTLAHEMGHSMHSYFSDTYQPQSLANYPIFLAEIASIFNELMLYDHLLQTSTNDKEKFHILGIMISAFNGSVLRQTMWSNYELNLYKAIEKGIPCSSYEAISKLYFNTVKKYSLNNNHQYNSKDQHASIYVPHFYYGFYVYKYAIGQLVANIFFKKYKMEGQIALQRYIKKFLSAGECDHPLNILKNANVDLYDPKTYQIGFNQLDDMVKEWIKLGRKIFKI